MVYSTTSVLQQNANSVLVRTIGERTERNAIDI